MDGGSLPGREDESITGIFCGVFCICFLLQLPFCIDRGPEVHGVVDQFNLVIGALFIGHDCKWFCRSRGIVVLISTEDLLFFSFGSLSRNSDKYPMDSKGFYTHYYASVVRWTR